MPSNRASGYIFHLEYWKILIAFAVSIVTRYYDSIIPPSNNLEKLKGELNNIHPGEILQEEFLIPLKISAYK